MKQIFIETFSFIVSVFARRLKSIEATHGNVLFDSSSREYSVQFWSQLALAQQRKHDGLG